MPVIFLCPVSRLPKQQHGMYFWQIQRRHRTICLVRVFICWYLINIFFYSQKQLIFFNFPNSKPCSAGKFGDSLAGSNESVTCKDCPHGFYQSAQASIECTACANGKFGNAAQQTAISSCKDCVKGRYLDQAGQSICKDCLAGQFGDVEGATKDSQCEKCPSKFINACFFCLTFLFEFKIYD